MWTTLHEDQSKSYRCRPQIRNRSNFVQHSLFLGEFADLRRATSYFVMSVRLSVRMGQLGSHWADFHEILYLTIFRKPLEKIQILLNSDKNNGYKTDIHF